MLYWFHGYYNDILMITLQCNDSGLLIIGLYFVSYYSRVNALGAPSSIIFKNYFDSVLMPSTF